MSEGVPPDELFELLADEYVRTILTETTEDRKSVSMLTDTLDAARSTVYDRIDCLLDAGLLDEQTELDKNGNHYATYRARLDRFNVQLTSDGFSVETQYTDRDAAADQLSNMWSNLE